MMGDEVQASGQQVEIRKRRYLVIWEADGTARVLRRTRRGDVEVRGLEAFRVAKAARGERVRRPSAHAKRPRRFRGR